MTCQRRAAKQADECAFLICKVDRLQLDLEPDPLSLIVLNTSSAAITPSAPSKRPAVRDRVSDGNRAKELVFEFPRSCRMISGSIRLKFQS